MVFIECSRIGPTVRVGPFESVEAAKRWIDERAPHAGWGIVPLQDPSDPVTPDWN